MSSESEGTPADISSFSTAFVPHRGTRHEISETLLNPEPCSYPGIDRQELIRGLTQHLDISLQPTRAFLYKETFQRTFDDRFLAYTNILMCTYKSGTVAELIKTLKWFFPRIRNEITIDMYRIPDSLRMAGSNTSLWLENATPEEAKELVDLYPMLDDQNTSAISPNDEVDDFTFSLAEQCLFRFAHVPTGPFFAFGLHCYWHKAAAETDTLETLYICRTPETSGNESLEVRRWIATKHAKNEKHGKWGCWLIPEGGAVDFAHTILDYYEAVARGPKNTSTLRRRRQTWHLV
ncbi:hypothetical protein DFJ77DRAFT_116335 [Powellomyces hirtus]|nr:hypothetical protein DFJ77DRAFT_116335 [Powellomyces hirtus]